jgi:3-dehydroquinate synthase
MKQQTIQYTDSATAFYFGASLDKLKELAPAEHSYIITDENLALHYARELKPWRTIIIPPGEASKSLAILDDVVRELIALDAGRDALIVGFGGGVVTDIAGFVAGVYKRGVRYLSVPTSILAMVDAAIGGKNGLDIGEFKNMIGLIRQPECLLYDYSLLNTLPEEEWINGFAEIIKHACIRDAEMFALLQQHDLKTFMKDGHLLAILIERNALLKADIVQADEYEQGERKLLNFGHTLGHAIENTYQLPHGHAVSIGMAVAAGLSEALGGFKGKEAVISLIEQYHLTAHFDYDRERALACMQADKKKAGDKISYVLLETIGKAVMKPLSIDEIRAIIA